jgi:regulator of cell morphogenesis and NO signaling
MMNEVQELTIKEIVTGDFRTAAIFEKYSLDFCCGGGKTIEQACREKSVDPAIVLEDLRKASGDHAGGANRFGAMELDALIDHIVTTHHGYVRQALPAILAHTQKVASVHGERHPEVIRIATRVAAVAAELHHHMMKEEQILFPYIKALVQAKRENATMQRPPFGSAQNPIRMMEAEHQSAGNEMYEIRSLSSSYTPPADACTTFRVSYLELQQFELDLHTHVHLENNILFPKTLTLEQQMIGS